MDSHLIRHEKCIMLMLIQIQIYVRLKQFGSMIDLLQKPLKYDQWKFVLLINKHLIRFCLLLLFF